MQADDAESPRGATAVATTAAAALVGPYPIDEDALRKLKRSHDDGVIDDHTFKCRKAEALGLAVTEPPQAYMYYARRGDFREGLTLKGASGPVNLRDADGALLLEAPFGKVGGARVVMKGILHGNELYASKLRAKPNFCSDGRMKFETDFGYKLEADLPPVKLSLYSHNGWDVNGEDILMGLYSANQDPEDDDYEVVYLFKANDTHDWPESTFPPEIRLVRFDPAPISRWHDLVNHHVLPRVCVFLDAPTMGLLEICGKQCLGHAEQAWNLKAAGIPKGALDTLSSKQFLAAHTHVQALSEDPEQRRYRYGWAPDEQHVRLKEPCFDEFVFTLVLTWGEEYRVAAALPYMPLTRNDGSLYHGCMRNYDCRVSPSAEGQAIIAAKLLELGRHFDDYEVQEFLMNWSVTLICTRKSDGASVKLDNFSNHNEDWTIKEARPTTHPLMTKTYFGGQGGFYVKFTDGDLPLRPWPASRRPFSESMLRPRDATGHLLRAPPSAYTTCERTRAGRALCATSPRRTHRRVKNHRLLLCIHERPE